TTQHFERLSPLLSCSYRQIQQPHSPTYPTLHQYTKWPNVLNPPEIQLRIAILSSSVSNVQTQSWGMGLTGGYRNRNHRVIARNVWRQLYSDLGLTDRYLGFLFVMGIRSSSST